MTTLATTPLPPRPQIPTRLSAIALTILSKRYLIRGSDGVPTEVPEDMFWRVAYRIAEIERRFGKDEEEVLATAEAFYGMMVGGFWMPNSPTLMNAGRPLGQLSACFVLPVDDALSNGESGIYDTLRSMAMVHQSGGGTGFSFSRLRPEGDLVRSTTGVASGPVSFMKLYDASTDVVKQGGTRRGANMAILRVDHPDIEGFIAAKEDLTQLTNFNISVAITDAFMAALAAGAEYDLVDPRTGQVVGQRSAKAIFDRIVQNAWRTGEPGVFYVDRANHFNPVPKLGAYEATNPCGEQPLLPYDVCNLGSINLGAFVRDGEDGDWRARIDWDLLRVYTRISTRFLDNVIDANNYPLQAIHDLAQKIRRIGNGPMGFADMLVRLGVPYGSPESITIAKTVAQFFHEGCLVESEVLATERGVFPAWEESIWGPDETCARDAAGQRIRPMRRLRNCNVNTVAPTGTISIIAGCSSGIEPLFAVAFMRNQAGSMMPDVNGDFVAAAKGGGWYSDALMERIAQAGHIHFPEVPAAVQSAFVTAHDVTPSAHVTMQAAWQEHVDSAISKTTNFPSHATPEDVREVYLLAYRLGCKGVTVYRDGARAEQVLSTGATSSTSSSDKTDGDPKAPSATELQLLKENEALRAEAAALRDGSGAMGLRERPRVLHGYTEVIQTMFGKMYVTINSNSDGQPMELFATLGNVGSVLMADVQAMARMASMALRANVPIRAIHKQLRGISSDKATGFGPNKVLSLPDAIGQILERHMARMAGVQSELPFAGAPLDDQDAPDVPTVVDRDMLAMSDQCDECHAVGSIEVGDGCIKCHACGHSKCS